MKRILTFLCMTALLFSCGANRRKALLPTVSGKAGEVIVVMDKSDWEGELGNRTREILAGDCPFLPWKEPMYSLVYVNPQGFTDLFKVHRNIVVFNVGEQREDGVNLLQDVWAAPQCIVNVCGKDSGAALAVLEEKSSTVVSAIEQAERDRVIRNTLQYEIKDYRSAIVGIFGGGPHIPVGYTMKKRTDDFVWIADEKQSSIQGIFIYSYPASGDNDFSLSNIVRHRNEILRDNVPGMFDGTYMTTSRAFDPQLEYIKYHGREFAQLRGLWEVENDFMGGPFVSHSFYSPDGQDIIVLEAFVYAPKFDKRQYLRQTESILYSWE